jgi:hypothetical protein
VSRLTSLNWAARYQLIDQNDVQKETPQQDLREIISCTTCCQTKFWKRGVICSITGEDDPSAKTNTELMDIVYALAMPSSNQDAPKI